jgi:hypothetical protein
MARMAAFNDAGSVGHAATIVAKSGPVIPSSHGCWIRLAVRPAVCGVGKCLHGVGLRRGFVGFWLSLCWFESRLVIAFDGPHSVGTLQIVLPPGHAPLPPTSRAWPAGGKVFLDDAMNSVGSWQHLGK